MSSPAASGRTTRPSVAKDRGKLASRSSGRRAEQRRSGVRRRRSALVLVGAGLAILLIVLAMPIARKAVNALTLPLRDQDIIRQQAHEKHLDPALIAAVIYAETKFDPSPSPAGAQGLMQILPQTAEFLAHRSGATTFTTADLATPQVNIAYGSYYLRYLLDSYRGQTMLAVAAYNGGEANVNRWVADAHARGETLTVDEIPFPETRAYVRSVLARQRDYRRTYRTELGYR